MMYAVSIESFSAKGQRASNQDFTSVASNKIGETVAVVCDGIGGWEKGEVASKIVAETFKLHFESTYAPFNEKFVTDTTIKAYKNLWDYLQHNELVEKLGTTLAGVGLGQNYVSIFHLGDSRVLHCRGGQLHYATQDHKYVTELVQRGIISEEQAQTHPSRNMLSRCIKASKRDFSTTFELPDIHVVDELCPDDYFIAVTDGVLESLSEVQLAELTKPLPEPGQLAEQVIEACQQQSKDNYSGIIIRIL